MSYIDLLLNDDFMKDLINSIDICNEKIIKTKNQKLRSTASCRVWQLKLSIINYYLKKYYSSILSVDIVTEICIIINNFLSSKPNTDSILHRLIFFNQPINITKVNTIIELQYNHLDLQNYYMCIYNPKGHIIHFFTIIRFKDIFYLNSSYGSDVICVPQYTQLLVLEEFNNFCIELPIKSPNFINFYTKYFLKYNLPKRYNNNTIEDIDPSLKSKWISSTEGITKEISILVESENVYYVGLINNYDEYIEEFIKNNLKKEAKGKKKKKSYKKKSYKKKYYNKNTIIKSRK